MTAMPDQRSLETATATSPASARQAIGIIRSGTRVFRSPGTCSQMKWYPGRFPPSENIQEATKATLIPLSVMRACEKGLLHARTVAQKETRIQPLMPGSRH